MLQACRLPLAAVAKASNNQSNRTGRPKFHAHYHRAYLPSILHVKCPGECPYLKMRHTTSAQPTRLIRFHRRTRERPPDRPSDEERSADCGCSRDSGHSWHTNERRISKSRSVRKWIETRNRARGES